MTDNEGGTKEGEDESVKLACQGLEAAVNKYCRRLTKKKRKRQQHKQQCRNHPTSSLRDATPSDIANLVAHACHILQQLVTKRRSLSYGLSALEQSCQIWMKHLSMLKRSTTSTSSDNNNNRTTTTITTIITQLLTHIFYQYLRLSDGITLLISGECRHDGDIQYAKKQQQQTKPTKTNKLLFPSKLNQQSERKDGYTKLYSSQYYSGYGWDEFFDPHVGVQRSLQTALLLLSDGEGRGRNDHNDSGGIWDTLLDYGGRGYECCLDNHEVQLQTIQHRLEALRRTIVKNLLTHCPHCIKTVKFLSQDKMERLEVTLKNTNTNTAARSGGGVGASSSTVTVSLQRRASDFQVHDINGCLPDGWTEADWKRAMELPSSLSSSFRKLLKEQQQQDTTTKRTTTTTTNDEMGASSSSKRRRIILDDSDDDDDDAGVKTCLKVDDDAVNDKSATSSRRRQQQTMPGTGLRVEVKDTSQEMTNGGTLDVSLMELKQDCKVDAKALERSREQLEAEQIRGTGDNARNIQDMTETSEELEAIVSSDRIKVERLKRVVARVQARQDEYDDELWDARECLREASMTLGSDLLLLCDVEDEHSKEKGLQEANESFFRAQNLVKKQEEVHQTICRQTNDSSSEGARAIRRKLLLLRGRAHVNRGIALVELSRLKCPESARKKFEEEAITELESAESCADAIRSHTVTDESKGASPSEMTKDRIEADQLDSLVNRWLGNLFWHQRRHKEASVAFEKCSRFFVDRRHSVSDEDILVAEIELGTECFFGCMTLADLALNSLEKLQIVVQGHPRRQECLSKGEALFAMAKKALKRASSVSGSMQTIATHKPDTVRKTGVHPVPEIEKNIEEMNAWWEEKKSGTVLRHKEGNLNRESGPVRNDVLSSGPLMSASNPVKRFTVHESASRRTPRRHSQGTNSFGSSFRSTRAAGNLGRNVGNSSSASVRCRKWGDDLLPQIKTESGEMVPKIVYPAAAPELPLGLRPYKPN